MDDLSQIRISCSGVDEIVAAKNAVITRLSPAHRDTLNRVFSDYLVCFGLEGVFQRMNDRTIADIFDQYDSTATDAPFLRGCMNETSFELYDRHDSSAGTHHIEDE